MKLTAKNILRTRKLPFILNALHMPFDRVVYRYRLLIPAPSVVQRA